jgi:acyl-CoA oxidase
VSARVNELNPLAVRDTDEDKLRSHTYHAEALRFREESLLSSLAKRVNRRVREGMSAQDAFEACQDHALSAARAHVERFVHKCFSEGAQGEPLLESLCSLYGLWCLERDLAWYLENGYLAPEKSRAVRKLMNGMVNELRASALGITRAFGVPESCLGPLADPAYLVASGLASEV